MAVSQLRSSIQGCRGFPALSVGKHQIWRVRTEGARQSYVSSAKLDLINRYRARLSSVDVGPLIFPIPDELS